MAKAIERKEIVLNLTEEEAGTLLQFFYDERSGYHSCDAQKILVRIEEALEGVAEPRSNI
jgi:hypothetical protein